MHVVPIATSNEEAFKMNSFGRINGDKLIVAQLIEKCTDFCANGKFVFGEHDSAPVVTVRNVINAIDAADANS